MNNNTNIIINYKNYSDLEKRPQSSHISKKSEIP